MQSTHFSSLPCNQRISHHSHSINASFITRMQSTHSSSLPFDQYIFHHNHSINAFLITPIQSTHLSSLPFNQRIPHHSHSTNVSQPAPCVSLCPISPPPPGLPLAPPDIRPQVGAQVLLMDEDTCATNFMIRDLRMQLLVSKDKEPITPFLAKVQALYTQHGISSLLVIGGAGDYFEVADTVIMMDNYTPLDKTVAAKAIADQYSSSAGTSFFAPHFGTLSRRLPVPASLRTEGKVVARGKDKLQYGEEDVDLSGVEQLVEKRSFAVIRGVTCKCGKAKKEMDVDGRDSQMKVVSRVQDVNHLEPIARFVLPFQPLLHSSQSFYPSYGIWPRVFMGMDFIEACLTSSLACCPDICGLVSIASIVPLSSSYLGASAGSDTIKRKMSKVRRSRAIRMLQESRR
ncbi:ABC transporter, ATPase, putative [Nannochloropsis gaditana]|uniref:ABC transporter, ATPase, putative n=1 Tax=Nannochloropsis gaditana TaxID=72520 RepID=W7TBB4_9STRA|nr:ABC transporter, ATPase, putative [Nannochloropsis gaditana]